MQRRSSFGSQFMNAVLILIGLNIIMFVLQQVVPGLTGSLMLTSDEVLLRPWTLLTSMFLHGGLSHLLFNMYALLLFGSLIEQKIGTKRFVGIYLISGILAGLGFVVFQELIMGSPASAVGASGGMMGIIGMTIMLLPNLRVLLLFFIPMSMRTAGIIIALIDIAGVFGVGIPGIANIAHLVGLACGIGYGYYLLRQKKEFDKRFASRRGPRQGPGPQKVIIKRSSNTRSSRHPGSKRKQNSDIRKGKVYDVNSSIEMSKEEMDDYLKHGRL